MFLNYFPGSDQEQNYKVNIWLQHSIQLLCVKMRPNEVYMALSTVHFS